MSASRMASGVAVGLLVVLVVAWECVETRYPASSVSVDSPAAIEDWTHAAILRRREAERVQKWMRAWRLAQEAEDEVSAAVKMWAFYYEVDEEYAFCVAQQESSLDAAAVGDDGNAVGLWQFWLPTWEMFREKMEASTADLRADAAESTRTAMWAFANGYAGHWAPVKRGLCQTPQSG